MSLFKQLYYTIFIQASFSDWIFLKRHNIKHVNPNNMLIWHEQNSNIYHTAALSSDWLSGWSNSSAFNNKVINFSLGSSIQFLFILSNSLNVIVTANEVSWFVERSMCSIFGPKWLMFWWISAMVNGFSASTVKKHANKIKYMKTIGVWAPDHCILHLWLGWWVDIDQLMQEANGHEKWNCCDYYLRISATISFDNWMESLMACKWQWKCMSVTKYQSLLSQTRLEGFAETKDVFLKVVSDQHAHNFDGINSTKSSFAIHHH